MRLVLIPLLLVARVALGQSAPTQEAPAPAPPREQAPLQTGLSLPPLPPIEIRRGEQVRVREAWGQSHTGELVGLTPETLQLQTKPNQVVDLLLSGVSSLELKKRSPTQGAAIGAAVGGVSGLLYFGLFCSYIAGENGRAPQFCLLLPTLLSSAAGAAVGALLGMGMPRWATVYSKGLDGRPPVLSLKEFKPERMSEAETGLSLKGEVSLQLGHAWDMRESFDGWGWRVHLITLLGPYFAAGPEMARYTGIGTRNTDDGPRPVFQLGGLVRIGMEAGPVRIAGVGGLGYYKNRSDHLGASAGGTVEVRLWKRLLSLAADVRYHINLEEAPIIHTDPNFLTVDLGTRLRW